MRERGAGAGGGLGDMFGDIFGGGFRRTTTQNRARKGADAETTTTVGFTDAMDGVTISLRLSSDAPCPDCSGTGGKPGTKPHICPDCDGAGFVVNASAAGSRSTRPAPAAAVASSSTTSRARPARAAVADCRRARSRRASPRG